MINRPLTFGSIAVYFYRTIVIFIGTNTIVLFFQHSLTIMRKSYPLLEYFPWLLILCLFPISGQAQNEAKVDSLQSVLKQLEGVERIPAL